MDDIINTTDPVIITTHMTPDGVELSSFASNPNYQKLTFWNQLKQWFTKHDAEIVVNTKDMNNSPNDPYDNPPKPAIEVGFKITF